MNRFSSVRRAVLGLALMTFLAAFLGADEKTDKVDKLFAQWDTTISPGAALAIIKDGEVMYERGYGMAKLEDGLIMTPSKIFDLASVSKQFTAACIAILTKQGKISLDDDVRRYIPELPRYDRPITVKHLIYHTSGLRDYTGLLELAGFRSGVDSTNAADALEIISRQKKLNYPPGEEYSYTNSGYFLLGQVVERVSGKSLNEFAQEHIFKPLGMKHSLFQDDHTQIIKDRASGYSQQGSGYKYDLSNWDQTGDGNLYTSVEDLCLWDQAFYNDKLGRDLMEMLQTPGVLNNGKTINYAFGLRLTEYKGLKVVNHGGSWAGFRTAIVRFPDEKFSVICLANLGDINAPGLCFKVADIYLADLLKEKPPEEKKKPEPITLSKQELEEKAGNYQDEKFGEWVSLVLQDGKLTARIGERREHVLTPISKTTFVVLDSPAEMMVEFLLDASGKPNRAMVRSEQEVLFRLAKAAPLVPMTPAKLKEYTGDYISEELLDAKYRFVVEQGNLVLKFRSASNEPLKAMAPDKFTQNGLNFDFVRKKGRLTGFNLNTGRAAGIAFVKSK